MADSPPLSELLARLQDLFPPSILPDGWWIIAVSALMTASSPQHIAQVYTFLVSQPQYQAQQDRRRLSRKLRAQLLQSWLIMGMPRTAIAFLALASVEAPEDTDSSFLMKGKTIDEATRGRGVAFLRNCYGSDFDRLANAWGSHSADMNWVLENVAYGLFWSDDQELSDIETELLMSSSVLCQTIPPRAKTNHLNLLSNLGMSRENIKRLESCIDAITGWAGVGKLRDVSIDDIKG